MNDTNCLFCKITAGEIPCEKIYEDADTLVFMDIRPVNPGHMLVIPKAHHANIFEAPEELFAAMAKTSKRMAAAAASALGTSDMNITMNNGEHAGQVIFHAHIHVIPRFPGDGHEQWHGKPYGDGELAATAEKIKKAL